MWYSKEQISNGNIAEKLLEWEMPQDRNMLYVIYNAHNSNLTFLDKIGTNVC